MREPRQVAAQDHAPQLRPQNPPRSRRRFASAFGLLLACALGTAALAHAAAHEEGVKIPPIDLPQARIDAIDIKAWPKVRVLATILDRRGTPVEVKAITKLDVRDGKSRSAPPLVSFVNGASLEGRKDGKVWPASKAGVRHASVVIVAGHQHDALRRGTLGQRLKEAVAGLLKKFAKTDRGNLFWVADRIRAWWDLKGRTTLLADVEEARRDCDAARAEALSGLPLSMSGKPEQPAPGTDICGLRDDIKDVATAMANTSFEGFFPRPFGLGTAFFDHGRYCKPPREALAGYGQITPENARMQKEKRDEMELRGEALDYTSSGMDEALRLLLRDGRTDEAKSIILVSDGKDGYLRDLELCREAPPPPCDGEQGGQRQKCLQDVLGKRVVAEQADFREKATHWLGVARAAGIRIFAVGIGSVGERWELDRLRLLAERSGGTYREAASEADLAGAVALTGSELFDQVVIDFVHQAPDEVSGPLDLKLALELDPTMVTGDTKLETRAFGVDLPEQQDWKQLARGKAQDAAASAQEALGYRIYVWVGIALLAIVGLIALLLTFWIVRGVVRFIVRLVRRVTA